MAGVRGVGGVPEPTPERPTELRNRKREEIASAPVRDGVQISSTAQQAAEVARLRELAGQEPDIRADRVAAAKERIERGDYKREDIVAKVAEKILPGLPE